MALPIELAIVLKCFILLNSLNSAKLQDLASDKLLSELQMDDLELIDMCENLAAARKSAFLNSQYHDKIKQEQDYRFMVKSHYDVLRTFVDIPIELERNWTYQVKPGDALLPEDKWNRFILYQNHIEELERESKLLCPNRTEYCLVGRNNYQDMLSNERRFDTLKGNWQNWQSIYNDSDDEFRSQLELVKEAALLNEFETVQEYWEALSGFSGAYEQANAFWEDIAPFYKKLQKFVKTRLFKYHNLNSSSEDIPVFLLGSELGSDWTNIADIILPHPQLHFDIESYLKQQKVKDIYEYSESMATNLGFDRLGDKFWRKSNFNFPVCGPRLFEFCDQAYTEIIDCNRTSWLAYLKSHESTLIVALNNLDYTSLLRHQLRYCAIDDAVITLGTLLAVENLEYHGIINENTNKGENDPERMTKLLLVALRVMSSLAYSLMADKWRMEVLERNSSNIAETWWKYRKEYTGIRGIQNLENEYLQDARIISNEPYINNFFGILIAFQLLAYYEGRSGDQRHIMQDFGEDDTFMTMIKQRHTTDWPYLLTIHYGLDLDAAGLLKYFEPLERYFDTAPSEQVTIVTPTSPTTTTTTTTTETITTTTAELPVTSKSRLNPSFDSELVNDQPKLNSTSMDVSIVNGESATLADSHVAMYVGVAILIVLGCVLAMGFVYKNIRRRRRTNNRRFDT